MVSHHTARFCSHRDSGSRIMMFLVVEAQDSTYCSLNPSLLFISKGHHMKAHGLPYLHLFFISNPFLTLAPKIVLAFLKNRPKKLFSNCLVDGLLTSII